MRNLLIFCFLVTALAIFKQAYATNDQSCTPISTKSQGEDIILLLQPQAKYSSVYFFSNIGDKSIFIDHPSSHGVSAGWSSYLRPGNWSAIALNKSTFTVRCSAIEPGNVITLDCSKVLSICAPSNLQVKTPIKSSIWLTEDKPWDVFMKALESKGINLKQTSSESKT